MNEAKRWATGWVSDVHILDEFEWKFETIDLEDLIDLRFSSCDHWDPCHVITPGNQQQWFEAECTYIRCDCGDCGGSPWDWMLEEDGFDPGPDDPQEMIFSFHRDEDGPYLAIWDGHHRLAAAYIRGIKQLTVVVGREKKKKWQ